MKEKLSNSGKGFHMTFENGLTISVQWGYDNYCNNKTYSKGYQEELNVIKEKGLFTGETAEIAVWNAEGKWMNFKYDQVKGWLPPDTIADYIHKVKNAISIDELHEGEGFISE